VSEGTSSARAEGLLSLLVLGVLLLMVVPVPPFAMDLLLAANLALSVLMLLVGLALERPVEFSVFPSLLLVSTLFRLSLNIASTRLILLGGGGGTAAAGRVIEAFGRIVLGGSLVVGAVVFVILVVVNFLVITKGASRVSEVAARFTLDALPGKQMSIDADLAAGVVDDREARARRQRLEQETEFFGAMDGAGKFVRGDAVAGLVIVAVNVVGGFVAGVVRDGLSPAQAAETYTLLSVGDGLVSQLPALLVSTAAGIVVTRGAGAGLATQVRGQLLGRPGVLHATAGVLALMALVPGVPALPFAVLATGLWGLGRGAQGRRPPPPAPEPPRPERLQDLLALDALEVEVGHALVPLLDADRGGELPSRVTALRRQVVGDLGVVLPAVHLRDSLRLDPNEYAVRVRGNEVARATAYADRLMVLEPRGSAPEVAGIAAREPAFGLPCVWIAPAGRVAAEAAGLTVVEPAAVVTTHLSELVRRHAWELVGRQEVQELVAACAREHPKLVEDTIPALVSLGDVVRVVRGLLRERVPVRDLRTVLEAVADAAVRSKDPVWLTEQARLRLSRTITSRSAGPSGAVRALSLDRGTEDALRASLGTSDGEPSLAPDVSTARELVSQLQARASALAVEGLPAVLLAPPDLRRPLFDLLGRFVPDLSVVSARELVSGTAVEPAGTLTAEPARRVQAEVPGVRPAFRTAPPGGAA